MSCSVLRLTNTIKIHFEIYPKNCSRRRRRRLIVRPSVCSATDSGMCARNQVARIHKHSHTHTHSVDLRTQIGTVKSKTLTLEHSKPVQYMYMDWRRSVSSLELLHTRAILYAFFLLLLLLLLLLSAHADFVLDFVLNFKVERLLAVFVVFVLISFEKIQETFSYTLVPVHAAAVRCFCSKKKLMARRLSNGELARARSFRPSTLFQKR